MYRCSLLTMQGVTTALALQEGLSSPLFAVSLAFSVIVMYDAMGVRQHAGKQAAVLNQVCQAMRHERLQVVCWPSQPCTVGNKPSILVLDFLELADDSTMSLCAPPSKTRGSSYYFTCFFVVLQASPILFTFPSFDSKAPLSSPFAGCNRDIS